MDAARFRSLTARQRALVAIAVLIDGREAGIYLENDSVNGAGLQRAALEIAAMEPEQRMPFVGTALRAALKELG
ncbi:MAG: hypothetical protein DCC75_05475 [Proteobacteria bacterium]|nr:MAG: hypothetical protein DCC75_05475 [Pseudomonadota bacterium]